MCRKVVLRLRISTFIYLLLQGLKNIKRNKMFSLASVATMAACIFLFGCFFSVVMNLRYVVHKAEEGVAVTAFFDEGISEARISQIGMLIQNRSEVSELKYVSAEEAWDSYRNEYFGDDAQLAEGFKDDNPLADSDHYEIYLEDVSMQDSLVKYLQSIENVRKVNYSSSVANTLTDVNVLIGYISVAVIVILLAVAIFLISNTVTIGISVRREEISIMKLIGATDYFVRSPFIIEGAIIGLVGSSIPLIAVYYLYTSVVSFVLDKFKILSLDFIPVKEIFSYLLPVSLIIGLGVGLIGSISTIRKHLKV